jgi:metallo-beta-lactamase family protein
MSSLHFLGAAGTVTGSRHLVEHEGQRILLDCGLFQGPKSLRQRNWAEFAVPPSSIDAVVLSHAHIDHTGWLPRLVKGGFTGKVYTTPATRDLAAIMLPDSARLQEEEAEYANRSRYSKHQPALALYTEEDARASLAQFRVVSYQKAYRLSANVQLMFHRAGHILGSAIVQLDLRQRDGATHTVLFSGDLGRYGMPIIPDPDPVKRTTTLLVECTYGDRSHKTLNPRAALRDEVLAARRTGGALIIPSFAIGRAQDLLYHLRMLQLSGELPTDTPIFVDSPMACDATPLYLVHRGDHDDEMVRMLRDGKRPLNPEGLRFVHSVAESKGINQLKGPLIIIAGSGMATGGRVLHHLKHRLPRAETRVVFVGYQAEGTRGRRLLNGEPTLRMHGEDISVRASMMRIDGFSAHADQDEVDRWLSTLESPPERTFCVHGEPSALHATKARLQERGWNVHVPEHLEHVDLNMP